MTLHQHAVHPGLLLPVICTVISLIAARGKGGRGVIKELNWPKIQSMGGAKKHKDKTHRISHYNVHTKRKTMKAGQVPYEMDHPVSRGVLSHVEKINPTVNNKNSDPPPPPPPPYGKKKTLYHPPPKKKSFWLPSIFFWPKKKKCLDKSWNLFKFVSVLLSTSVERVGVSRMRDF